MGLNIIVCVKETYDVDHIKVDSATLDPVLQGIPKEIEELSKNALEAAIRLKEKNGGKVTALAVAPPGTVKKSIKEALAMGADEALVVTHGPNALNPAATALALAHAIRTLGPYDLVLLGEGSADNYSGQVGARVSGILDHPLVPYACGLDLKDGRLVCTADLEDGYEVLEAGFPVVVTVTNEANEPRLPSLSDILKASKKPLKERALDSLNVPKAAMEPALGSTSIIKNKAPRVSRKNIKLAGELAEVSASLISSLSKEGHIGR